MGRQQNEWSEHKAGHYTNEGTSINKYDKLRQQRCPTSADKCQNSVAKARLGFAANWPLQ